MAEQHKDTDLEWFRVVASVLIGIIVGVLVSRATGSIPVIMACATISAGTTLGFLRFMDDP